MRRRRLKILYLDGFTVRNGDFDASDAIGYGITASSAIQKGLKDRGYDIITLSSPEENFNGEDPKSLRLKWFIKGYRKLLEYLIKDPPNLIFIFHIFHNFPVEVKRMLLDLEINIPIIGYTHGSHWDPTDTFRFIKYPGLHLLDLANLYVMDKILVVSSYMRNTLIKNIAKLNKGLAKEIKSKIVEVGLPINIELMDKFFTERNFTRPTIVFNHSLIESKNPEMFLRVMKKLMKRYKLNVLITRKIDKEKPFYPMVTTLKEKYRGQVILGDTMPLEEYYTALWMSDIQVSTATHESLGIATLEAMYTKNCCILPHLGSYPEICGGIKRVLYPYGEKGLLERLSYFIENVKERKKVAEHLSKLSLRYSPEKVVSNISSVIESLPLV
jgi:glycosyltransferase involved in cell wall biosynthesis